jgi:hypothetical protein
MSSIASQLASLRKQHQGALSGCDYQRADLINQQIQILETQISGYHRGGDRTQVESGQESQRDNTSADSAQVCQTLAEQKATIVNRFRIRRQTIERLFAQDYDELCSQHLHDVEREMSRTIPEVEALLFESRVLGKEHQYVQARAVHEQAVKVRNSVNEERGRAAAVAFAKNERKLKERKARDLKQVEEREKSALFALEYTDNSAQSIAVNKQKVKDSKIDRTRSGVDRSGVSFSTAGTSTKTARRAQSVSTMNALSVVPKRIWQIGMETR